MSVLAPVVGPEPHLRDVLAFVAVAEHLHFTRAAEALFTSQPALSKQIRALERLLRGQRRPVGAQPGADGATQRLASADVEHDGG